MDRALDTGVHGSPTDQRRTPCAVRAFAWLRAAALAVAALASACTTEVTPPRPEPTCASASTGAVAAVLSRDGPPFVEAARALGVDFERHHTTPYTMPDAVGGGVCVFDVDNDHDLDLYFTDRAPYANRLYRNDGGGFTDVTALWRAGSTSDTMGCLAFDADADGDLDLLLTNNGPSVLLRNDGDAFSDATAESGIVTDNLSTSATAGDMDGDGDLDLLIGRFVDPASCASCPFDGVDDCQLDPHTCAPLRSLLFENRGGRFAEVGAERGITAAEPTLAALFVDFDIDGDLDLYVGNDAGRIYPDRMYMNDGTGHFVDRAEEMGLARDATEHGGDTMGVAVGDYDRDGVFDLVSTNIDIRPTLLFHCRRGPVCVDSRVDHVSLEGSLGTIGWGVGFVDVDNDGWVDIISASGQDYAQDAAQPSLLFWNHAGRYELHAPDAGDALADRGVDRGLGLGDLDGDGGVDVVIGPNLGPARVLMNQGPRGHHLTVALDTLGAGATVTVRAGGQTFRAPVVIGGSYLGSSSPWVSFGLGQACTATVVVQWLGGQMTTLEDVPVGRTVFVPRPKP